MRRDKCRGARLIGRTSRKSNFERLGEGVGGTCQWCARASVRTRRTVALGYFRRTWYKSRWRSCSFRVYVRPCVEITIATSRSATSYIPWAAGSNDLSTRDTRHETNRLCRGKHGMALFLIGYRSRSSMISIQLHLFRFLAFMTFEIFNVEFWRFFNLVFLSSNINNHVIFDEAVYSYTYFV